MTAHKLGQRMDNHIGAMIERPGDIRRGKRVIDDQRNAMIVRDLRHRPDIEYITARIADSFAVQQSSLRRNCFAEIFRIVRLDKYEVIPKPPHGDIELRERAAIESARRHDLIARRSDGRQCQELRRLPARQTSAATPFSSDATRSSSTAVVGFMMRL